MRLRFLLSLLALLSFLPAYSVSYKHYTSSQKLNSNIIYSVVRDSKGYLWFATSRGVCKYDGLTFKQFTIADGLGDDYIFYAMEDRFHRIWLSVFNGRNCYIKNDSVFNAANDPLVKEMPQVMFNAMCHVNDTVYYFGATEHGVFKMEGTSCKWIYKINTHERIRLMNYRSGKLYIYTTLRTIEHNEDNNKKTIRPEPERDVFFSNNKLLISDTAGVSVYENDRPIWSLKDPEFANSNINQLYADTSGYIFCSSNTGLHIINYRTNQSHVLFPKTDISSVTQDIAGNYWVTTLSNGVYRINKALFKLSPVHNLINAKAIPSYTGLFISEHDTLKVFSPSQMKMLPVHFNYNFDKRFYPAYLDSNHFIGIYRDQYRIYNLKSKSIISGSRALKDIIPLREGRFIFNFINTLVYVECKNDRLVFLDTIKHDNRITGMHYEESKQLIYYCIDNKFYQLSVSDMRNKQITELPNNEEILDVRFVQDKMLIYASNQHWYLYIPNTDQLIGPIQSPHGIYIINMFETKQGTLVHTNKGIYLWKPEHGNFTKFTPVNFPFHINEIIFLLVYDNNIYCNIEGELYVFDITLLTEDKDKPVFYIDKIFVNDNEQAGTNLVLHRTVSSDVRVLLSGLHFRNSTFSYRFRIVKNDEQGNWIKTEGNEIILHLQTHGKYRIDVKAVNEHGISSAIQSAYITLDPPFYYTSVFHGFIILLVLAGCVYSVYYYQARRKKHLQDELNHLQLEYKAVNSLLNPHFIFNAINNIQQLINNGSKENAGEYLTKLSKLIRQNIENLQFSLIPLNNELKLVQNYLHLQNLRFNNKINYQVSNNIDDLDKIYVPPLMVHTIVENSIVHGFKKDGTTLNIHIDLSLSTDDYIIITIADDGVGYNPSSQPSFDKSCMGLAAMRARLERLSAYSNVSYTLSIDNRLDTIGTVVTIILHTKLRDFTVG